jgi:hypothetical protein
MGRHQMAASSSARARVALGALPLVATVGAIGVGSVVMSPTAAEAPLVRPGGGVGAASPLPLAPARPGAPVAVLDLASTGGPVAADPIVPGRTLGATSTGRRDAEAAPRRNARAGTASGGGTVARSAAVRDADAPARRQSGGGGGGTADRDDSGGGSSGGSSGSGSSSGSGGSGGSGSSGSGGSDGSGGGGGRAGGLIGGVVGGLGHTVSGATSLLSFGESSSSSVLSFGS